MMTSINASVNKAKDWVAGSESKISVELRFEALMNAFVDAAFGFKSPLDGLSYEDERVAANQLSHRVCCFLDFKLRVTKGRDNREKVTAYTIKGWRDIAIRIFTRLVNSMEVSLPMKRSLLGDATNGLIPRLYQYCFHAVIEHELHSWHSPKVRWGKVELFLLLIASEAMNDLQTFNAESRVQLEALILILAIAAHRSSHFLKEGDFQGLLSNDLVVHQVQRNLYAFEGTLRYAKGMSTESHELQLQKFILRSPIKSHNTIFDLPAQIVRG